MLQYLKAYYKYRPRLGEATGQLDLVTKDGIVVDGQISFPGETGALFTATFEATSFEKRDELLFKKQYKLLWWDSIALASAIGALAFAISFFYDWITLKNVGTFGVLTTFILIFAAMVYGYRLVAGSRRRYRYIYAVEQFKRYKADEQWCAFSADVFTGLNETYMSELKRQCVLHGFGLVEIKQNHLCQLHITPSRQELFGNKRRLREFFEKNVVMQKAGKSNIGKAWRSFSTHWLPESSGQNSFSRYQKSVLHQITVIALSVVMIAFIIWRQAQELPVIYEDEEKYPEKLAELRNTLPESEPDTYIRDVKSRVKVPKKGSAYLQIDTQVAKELSEKGHADPRNIEIYVDIGDRTFIYDCARFYNLTGTHFILLDSKYDFLEDALPRLKSLRNAGFEANCLWTGCVRKGDDYYLVYLDLLFENKQQAAVQAENFNKQLKKKRLLKNPIAVEPIQFIK